MFGVKSFPCRRLTTVNVRNIHARRKSCNESFFSEWSPSMAYWLGFMFADGNVGICGGRYQISLGLQCSDYNHVDKFRQAIKSEFHLGLKVQGPGAYGSRCVASTSIYNDKMAKDLINLGCVPNKSLILEWNAKIPQNLINHFVRGYFDGDGSMTCQGHLSAQFAGTSMFLTQMAMHIRQHVLYDQKA